jgi:hypothetical protein
VGAPCSHSNLASLIPHNLYLLLVNVLAVESDRAERSPVLVLLPACDRHRLAENQIGKTLLGAAAVILFALRRVYALKANLVLLVAGVENRKRVAVRDRHDLAGDCLRLGRSRQAQKRGDQRGFDGLFIPLGHGVFDFWANAYPSMATIEDYSVHCIKRVLEATRYR